ncbi:MAG: Uma2 family endonuclease [Verrucomicrobiota bacterium]
MVVITESSEVVADDKFNLRIWESICADQDIAHLPHKIETNELGQVVMMPPPGRYHGNFQAEFAAEFRLHVSTGKVLGEFALSTSKGVKGPDAGWCSEERWEEQGDAPIFLTAPEICVEVMSDSNTEAEIAQKKGLYFEKGADEVWIVSTSGTVSFFPRSDPSTPLTDSAICPPFPKQL